MFVVEELGRAIQDNFVRHHYGWNLAKCTPELRPSPESLLAAMYLQFALVTTNRTGGVHFGRCAQCGTRLTLGPAGQRSVRKTCSDTCRTLLSRRFRRARALRAEGKSVKDICKAVHADAETVKGWINTTKE